MIDCPSMLGPLQNAFAAGLVVGVLVGGVAAAGFAWRVGAAYAKRRLTRL